MAGAYQTCLQRFVNNPVVYYTLLFFRWIPVVFIVGVVAWAYYAYVIELCLFTVNSILEKAFYLVGFHFFGALFLWSYYQTIFADIGKPSSAFFPPSEVVREIDSATSPTQVRAILERFVRQTGLPVTMRAFDGTIRYCEKCHAVKPDRCHHCSVCGQCVLKFDHHCPWVNTCVNFRNYKFFVQFLGYALLFCLWAFLTDLQYFIWFWKEGLKSEGAAKFHIMFMFFVAGMFAISVSTLFFYHLWLTSRNRSTIESFRDPMFTYGPDKNGFNLGSRRNFLEIFGPERRLWFLPIFSSRGDGCSYLTRQAPSAEPPRTDARRTDAPQYGATAQTDEQQKQTQTAGDGLCYPVLQIEPEADGLLNTRHTTIEDASDSESEPDGRVQHDIPLSGVAVQR